MIRRSILALSIVFSSPALADCQKFQDAWHVAKIIESRGLELSKLSALSTLALFSALREKYGADVPRSWRPEGAIVTKGATVTIVAPIMNGNVCYSIFLPAEYYDEIMKGA